MAFELSEATPSAGTGADVRHPATTDGARQVHSPKPVHPTTIKPVPVDVSLKDVTLFTKGCFATSGAVIRTSERVNTTVGGTPFYFFVLQDEKTVKVAVWNQSAQRIAEQVRTGMRVRIVNPTLVPANDKYSMGATAEFELRITLDTVVEVLEQHMDVQDKTIPLVEIEDLKNGAVELGTIVRVQGRVDQASRIFESDNGIARSDALLADDHGNRIQMTFWGESARQMHEGLEKRSVSIGPAKVVPARFNVQETKLNLSSLPRTVVYAAVNEPEIKIEQLPPIIPQRAYAAGTPPTGVKVNFDAEEHESEEEEVIHRPRKRADPSPLAPTKVSKDRKKTKVARECEN